MNRTGLAARPDYFPAVALRCNITLLLRNRLAVSDVFFGETLAAGTAGPSASAPGPQGVLGAFGIRPWQPLVARMPLVRPPAPVKEHDE